MNLINDAWIPVRRKNGGKIKIAPWQITEGIGTDSEIMELAAVRPDFNGALIQFLIGLLQTTCAPKGTSDWRQWLNKPPDPDVLKDKFVPISHAFNLDGDGPRFMQDLMLDSEDKKTSEEVEKLLIDAPGEKTFEDNKDLFIKRNRVKQMCLDCCAQALWTLQINAPEGGRGHWAGLRGGGPVSTVVLCDNLWRTIWCNILAIDDFAVLGTVAKANDKDKFPWLAPTRIAAAKTWINEKGKKEKEYSNVSTSQDIHPTQIYWATPRRIRLIINKANSVCDLCHANGRSVTKYYTKPYGAKYAGVIHPLTPTYKNKDGLLLSVHQHETMGYKHWFGYVQNTDEGKEPARVIKAAFNRRLIDFRLWAFGYAMNKMKASCWYEGIMPIIFIENEDQCKQYNAYITGLIRAADAVSDYLSKAVSKALKTGVFDVAKQRFWQETESEFYRLIALLRDNIVQDGDGLETRQAWHKYLVRKAEDIFNDLSQADMIEMVRAGRVARARNELIRNLYGRKLKQEILGLPT